MEQSGTLRIDLASGQAAGVIRGEGIVQDSVAGERTPGTEEPFARETIIDIPARYAALDERPHTIAVRYTNRAGATGTEEVEYFYAGTVDTQRTGRMTFNGTVNPTPSETPGGPEVDLYLMPDGDYGAESRSFESLHSLYRRFVPKFAGDWYLPHRPSARRHDRHRPRGPLHRWVRHRRRVGDRGTCPVRRSRPASTTPTHSTPSSGARSPGPRAPSPASGRSISSIRSRWEGSLVYEGSARLGEAYDIDALRVEWSFTTTAGGDG